MTAGGGEREAMAPRRRFVLTAKIEADSRKDLADALHALEFSVAAERLNGNSISGGPSYGWIVRLSEDEAVTHDSYFAAIEKELERLKPAALAAASEPQP